MISWSGPRYIFLYQDGKMGSSAHSPTEADLTHVRTGWLRIIKVSAHMHDNAGGGGPVPDYCEIDGSGVECRLRQAVKDTRSETQYHYIPELGGR